MGQTDGHTKLYTREFTQAPKSKKMHLNILFGHLATLEKNATTHTGRSVRLSVRLGMRMCRTDGWADEDL